MANWEDPRTRQRLGAALLDHIGLATVVVDASWTVVHAAGALEYVTGYSSADEIVGRSLLDFAHPDDLDIALSGIATAEALAPDGDGRVNIIGAPVTVRMIRADGSVVSVTVAAANLLEDPELEAIALRVQLAENQALVDRFVAGLATGAKPSEVLAPLAGALTYGIPASGIVLAVRDGGADVVVHAGVDPTWLAAAGGAAEIVASARRVGWPTGETVELDPCTVLPQGVGAAPTDEVHQVWVHDVASAEEPDRSCGCVVVLRRTTDAMQFNHRQELARAGRFVSLAAHQWRQDRELRHTATHDALTGIANRARFQDLVAELDGSGRRYVLAYLDLDGFKPVNDLHGHDTGDAVLRTVAERLRRAVRAEDLVARLGGDEFAVVRTDASDDDVADLRDRLVAVFDEPVRVGGLSIALGASVGVVHSIDAGTFGDVVRAADAAMYLTKRQKIPRPARITRSR